MRKMPKKLLTVITAATLSLSVLALPACSKSFTPLGGEYTAGIVQSNGGFVVEKGNYYYFINGVETYTSDNTYGAPVKGSLMRILKSDLAAGKNTAEIVVPSLMVAADYTSGIYVYGNRVYYATPNNVKNTSGEIENSYLSFASADLSGADVKTYFSLADNSTVYRFVEVDGTVYLVYVESSTLHSYNTATKTDTVLADGVTGNVLSSDDLTNPYIYYTMGVKVDIDNEGARDRSYNQIYCVRADATTAPYNYTYDSDYLEENDGVEPYVNLGTIVLDGIGALYTDSPTQFTHDLTNGVEPTSYAGYTYTLQSYQNGGIYFTRSDLATTSSTGETGWLYYLNSDAIVTNVTDSVWNSVSGNNNLTVVAQETTNAGTSALFYIDGDGHHYIYVDGSNMFRADVVDDTGTAATTLVARDVSGASLMYLDNTSDTTYEYVYYTTSGTTGSAINRAVYNGTEEDYKNLNYNQNKPYQPVRVLDLEHASGWYNFEIINGSLFFADTTAWGSGSYNYVSVFNLNNADGKLMNNIELTAVNEKYESVMGEEGYIHELSHNEYENLSEALKYYFYMGQDPLFYRTAEDYTFTADGYLTYESSVFNQNIQFAIDEGKKETYLYSEEEQELFKAYVEGKGEAEKFVENGKSYRTYSAFVTKIGLMNEEDTESLNSYWQTDLQYYTVEETDESLPAWAWALIGCAIGVVVIGAGLAVFFILRAKKKKASSDEKKAPLMEVDTTDNTDIDVYADEETATEEPVAEEEELQEPAPAEVVEEIITPVEEVAAPVEEPAPVEAPAEPEVAAPVEEPAPVEAPAEPEVVAPAEEPAPVEAPAEPEVAAPAPVEAPAEPEVVAPAEEPAPAEEEATSEEESSSNDAE